MKIEGWLFSGAAIVFSIITVAYWVTSGEIIGTLCIALSGGLAFLAGFYILYTGNLYPHKNIDIIFQSLTKLPQLKLKIICARSVFVPRLQKLIFQYHLLHQKLILALQISPQAFFFDILPILSSVFHTLPYLFHT